MVYLLLYHLVKLRKTTRWDNHLILIFRFVREAVKCLLLRQ